MTLKTHILNELRCYGYSDVNSIPDEMFDYLPENLDRDEEDEQDLIFN